MCRIVDLKINTNSRDILLCTLSIFIHNKLICICITYSDGFSRGQHSNHCVLGTDSSIKHKLILVSRGLKDRKIAGANIRCLSAC